MDAMLQQQTCRNNKELVCRWTKTSLNQRRCCSHCCSNLGANTGKTTHLLIDKAGACNIKRYVIWGFQKETRGHMFLVALIAWYKKSTHERKRNRVVTQEK